MNINFWNELDYRYVILSSSTTQFFDTLANENGMRFSCFQNVLIIQSIGILHSYIMLYVTEIDLIPSYSAKSKSELYHPLGLSLRGQFCVNHNCKGRFLNKVLSTNLPLGQ